jgi:four helix bundle protein
VDGFRGLAVYERSVGLADALWGAIGGWDPFARWSLGIQLVRAADSVGANLAEACGRDSRADRRRVLYLARGSAFETEHWLDRAEARGLDLPKGAPAEAREISRMLNGVARRWTVSPDD